MSNYSNEQLLEALTACHREICELKDKLETARTALKDIKEMTDADDAESYRCDDREGCLDTVFAEAQTALEKIGGGE